jgi:hypothetical protein
MLPFLDNLHVQTPGVVTPEPGRWVWGASVDKPQAWDPPRRLTGGSARLILASIDQAVRYASGSAVTAGCTPTPEFCH